jgi:hypothetical protein
MEAEHDSIRPAAVSARDAAIATVLSDIATDLYSIRSLVNQAVADGTSEEAAAMLDGAGAIACRLGVLAQRAGVLVGRGLPTNDDDTWMHPPMTCKALATLEGKR